MWGCLALEMEIQINVENFIETSMAPPEVHLHKQRITFKLNHIKWVMSSIPETTTIWKVTSIAMGTSLQSLAGMDY